MAAADLNLSTLELTSTLRTAPLNGQASSTDYNESQRESLVDLTTLADFINNTLLPLLNALPAGALLPTNLPVGIEGRTINSDTSDQSALFFDSLTSSPLTIANSLRIINGIVTTMSQQLIDMGIQVASLQARLASTNQNDIALALQNLSSALNQISVNQQIQSTEIVNLQSVTPTGNPGAPLDSLQGNNASILAGVPGTTCDFDNGITLLNVGNQGTDTTGILRCYGAAIMQSSGNLGGPSLQLVGSDSQLILSADLFAGGTAVAIDESGNLILNKGLFTVDNGLGINGQVLVSTGTKVDWVSRTAAINYVIDGGGQVITTGVKGQTFVPVGCTITGWTVTADQSGSAVVDVLTSTYAGFPSTSSIAGSDQPTLSSTQKNQDTTLTGWGNTAIAADSFVQFSVSSASGVERLNVSLIVTIP